MTLQTLEEHEKEKAVIHTFVESDKPKKNGIKCPKCETELFDTTPNLVVMACKTYIHCACCGWKGTRTV